MLFYYGDDPEGKPFYKFQIGSVLSTCLRKMEQDGIDDHETCLSQWFSDAVDSIPEEV